MAGEKTRNVMSYHFRSDMLGWVSLATFRLFFGSFFLSLVLWFVYFRVLACFLARGKRKG
jgi:hypothetical protein